MTDEQTKTINPTEKKECPTCVAEELIVAIAMGHSACGVITDPEKRLECMEHAMGIGPEKEKDIRKIMGETYDRTGAEGLDRYAKLVTRLNKATIIDKVGAKLEAVQRGDKDAVPPTEIEKALYRKFTRQEGI
jgi:hypothetical protein